MDRRRGRNRKTRKKGGKNEGIITILQIQTEKEEEKEEKDREGMYGDT